MKIIKVQFFIAFLTLLFVSCVNNKEEGIKDNLSNVKDLPVKLTNVEVKIDGMTCEIGCARLIQSKLYKTDGVNYADVSFEEKKGKITFDANQISDSELKTIIEGIAGGDLYKVVQIEEVLEFSDVDDQLNM